MIPLQLLNAITTEKQTHFKDLMYMTTWVNGREVMTMIDTGATNNFVSWHVTDQLGLVVMKNSMMLKAINLDTMPIYGSVVGSLKVGTWQAEWNFMVVNLDDFDLILGIEFLGLAKAFVTPHIKGILIGDERSPCFVTCCPKVQMLE
ncbi:Aspartic peptidase domain containing protein, partial [Parasponia andersonii]